MDPALLQFITILGAAGVMAWILKPMLPLHSDSEVQGLKEDKTALFTANEDLRKTQSDFVPLLRDILEILREDEEEGGKP
jgi:hypothetical protein